MSKPTKFDKKDIFYLIILFIFSILYFLRLFIPKESLFITPDVYTSDLVHINYSLKYVLSNFLKNNSFPYWDWNNGGGFPLIGESQIGAFYILNILLFKLFPFNFAFNSGYVIAFFIASFGCYLFFRRFTENKLLVFLSSLIFSYSAPMFVQISHYNLLQTYSLIPIIFYFLELYLLTNIKKIKILYFVVLALLLSQQFYAGYVMTSFMTFLFIGFYIIFKSTIFYKVNLVSLIKKTILINLGLGSLVALLSINQLLPLIEFAKLSVRSNSGSYASTANSLSPLIFLTYFKFDYFHAFDTVKKSISDVIQFSSYRNIFWDSNLYIGVFPLITSIVLSIIFIKKRSVIFILSLFFIALLFAMGQNSPLNFFYGLPPFSFFRTPFRFNIFMTFFTILIFLVTIDSLLKYFDKTRAKNQILQILFIILSGYTIFNLTISSLNYHKTVTVEKFRKNIASDVIPTYPNSTIYNFGNELVWYQTLLYKKWFDEEIYLFFMKDFSPYINELSRIQSANIFFASFFSPKKQFYFDSLIRLSLIRNLESRDINSSFDPADDYPSFLKKMYDISYNMPIEVVSSLKIKGVKYFITPLKLKDSKNIRKIKELSKLYDGQRYYIRFYEIVDSYPSAYLTDNYAYINTVNDAMRILKQKDGAIPTFGYENINLKKTPIIKYTIRNYSKVDNQIKFNVVTDNPGLLVTTGSYYPGIKIFVNNINTKAEEVNFNQIAFKIAKGDHNVIITYKPDWLLPTNVISLFFYLTSICIISSIIYKNQRTTD